MRMEQAPPGIRNGPGVAVESSIGCHRHPAETVSCFLAVVLLWHLPTRPCEAIRKHCAISAGAADREVS